jgi:tetratricopeptide (TPR) repeat protein
MRKLAAVIALAFLAAAVPPVYADPEETDPDASRRDEDYAAGKKAVEEKDWARALERFKRAEVRNPENADLQNYIGYSHRNLKQYDQAFTHYKRAIQLNPRHRGAHEYIGEAYLMVRDLANAREHLAALEGICLLPCEELSDLKDKIAAYKSGAR